MKVSSVHFILKGKSDYKDLAPVFPDILKMFLESIDQMPEEEEKPSQIEPPEVFSPDQIFPPQALQASSKLQ